MADELHLTAPLSFWGGLDPDTGEIIDVHHPQCGQNIKGRVLYMPQGRGSSSSPSVLAEALRLGNGPRAIILDRPDSVVWLGAFIADLLYGIECPVTISSFSHDGEPNAPARRGAGSDRPARG